ncbi:hypothetical protein HAX54_049968, partial [Datura stramonium]|nr:hypothetical protein [Datura stramonium]
RLARESGSTRSSPVLVTDPIPRYYTDRIGQCGIPGRPDFDQSFGQPGLGPSPFTEKTDSVVPVLIRCQPYLSGLRGPG